jgi:hypothetical protein
MPKIVDRALMIQSNVFNKPQLELENLASTSPLLPSVDEFKYPVVNPNSA